MTWIDSCLIDSHTPFSSIYLIFFRLYGDYESLIEGDTADALVDFTGGVAEKLVLMNINLQDDQMKMALFRKLRDASENQALINCNIRVCNVYVSPIKLNDVLMTYEVGFHVCQ